MFDSIDEELDISISVFKKYQCILSYNRYLIYFSESEVYKHS